MMYSITVIKNESDIIERLEGDVNENNAAKDVYSVLSLFVDIKEYDITLITKGRNSKTSQTKMIIHTNRTCWKSS